MQGAEMDMAEWELVDDRYYEFPRKPVCHPDGTVDMNYYNPLTSFSNPTAASTEAEAMEEMKEKMEPILAGDQDMISQVFFNKTKNGFPDIKIDSPPRTPTSEMKPQILSMGLIQFEEEQISADEQMESSKTKVIDNEHDFQEEAMEEEKEECSERGALTIWKWRIHGIGALCSIGVVAAAATIFIFFMGSRHRHKRLQNQRPKIQIYPDDKRIQQVVHQASRLNQALLTRATINFGGHLDTL